MTNMINGYPILHEVPTSRTSGTREGRVVIVFRPEHPVHRFVVAWQGCGDDGWHGGVYLSRLPDALREFESRLRRYRVAA